MTLALQMSEAELGQSKSMGDRQILLFWLPHEIAVDIE
jgi:hypothetical protein